MARSSEERSLQITSKTWFDWALPDVLAIHVPNEAFFGEDRQAAIIQMSLLKKQGFMPGVADWLLFWQQRDYTPDPLLYIPYHGAIELKIGSGQLSESQIKFRDKWKATGGLHAVCRSMNEIETTVKSWGLQPKYKTPVVNTESGRQMRQYAIFEAFRPLVDVLPTVNLTTN